MEKKTIRESLHAVDKQSFPYFFFLIKAKMRFFQKFLFLELFYI